MQVVRPVHDVIDVRSAADTDNLLTTDATEAMRIRAPIAYRSTTFRTECTTPTSSHTPN